MELKERTNNSVSILELAGRFDAFEAPKVTAWIEQNIGSGRSKVILNLHNVQFIDSVGLAVLVKAMKRCREFGGQLHLCELQQAVLIILELTHLNKALSILKTEEEALTAFLGQVIAPTLELAIEEQQIRVVVLKPKGRLDAFTMPSLREAQNQFLDEGVIYFIVDLQAVEFMDSAGISAVVNLFKRAKQSGGNVVLINPVEDSARRILVLTKFDQIFQVAANQTEAYKLLL